MKTIQLPSPNFEARRGVERPELVVLHYTGMPSGDDALKRLCDPSSKVSAHYLIEEDGSIFQMVDEKHRAWHAGLSFWRGETDINSRSIGIELVNPGHEFGYRNFPDAQMEALTELCLDIKQRHRLPRDAFLAHSDVAPLRKHDPGELFDWKRLAAEGIGIWPEVGARDHAPLSTMEAAELLCRFGYMRPVNDGDFDKITLAFQRHYDQQNLSGEFTASTSAVLRALVRT